MAPVPVGHAVIVVPELRSAIAAYRAAGFDVRDGGRHQGSPTHNALIPIDDERYLELLAFRSRYLRSRLRRLRETPYWPRLLARRAPPQQRFLQLACFQTGFADFCLYVPDLEQVVRDARSRRVEISDAAAMGRRRPDGQHLAWRLAIPAAEWLPFLIEDRTPRRLRVPQAGTHSRLRLQRISEIVVPVLNLPEVEAGYRRLLGYEPTSRDARGAVFSVGDLRVVLRSRRRATSAQRPRLRLVVAGEPPPQSGRAAADGLDLVTGEATR